MRQIVLDTETTGLDPKMGHRLIEIGAVEMVERRLTGERFHEYLNPQRAVDPGAFKVHGLSNAFLADKPLFAEVVDSFLRFIDGAELVIHNAPFDVGFINHELQLQQHPSSPIEKHCSVCDTLLLAREKHPRQKNNLDALCKRYGIDNRHRQLHGALLDAEILAKVFLAMTSGQAGLFGHAESNQSVKTASTVSTVPTELADTTPLRVVEPSEQEQMEHQRMMAEMSVERVW